MEPQRTSFVDVPGGRLAYVDVGSGPLVLCVPTAGDVRQQYRFLTAEWVWSGYRVALMDLRGHGESSPRWNDYSDEAVAGDIRALLDHLDAGPAFLVASSLSAFAAVRVAVDSTAPEGSREAVSGLCLVAPQAGGDPTGVPGMLTASMARLGARAWVSAYSSLYRVRPADFGDYRTALRRNLAENGRMAAVRAMLGARRADLASTLAEASCPTLVLAGAADRSYAEPETDANAIAESAASSEVAVLEGVGHYPPSEAPLRVTQHLMRFLVGCGHVT